ASARRVLGPDDQAVGDYRDDTAARSGHAYVVPPSCLHLAERRAVEDHTSIASRRRGTARDDAGAGGVRSGTGRTTSRRWRRTAALPTIPRRVRRKRRTSPTRR